MKASTLKLPLHLHWSKSRNIKIIEEFVVFLLALFLLANLAFLLYPKSKTLPFAKVANINVGYMDQQQIVDKFQAIEDDLKITINTQDSTRELNFSDLGITIDKQATAEVALGHRDNWYMPVASWWSNLSNTDSQPIFTVDEQKLASVADDLLGEFGEQSADATIFINDQGQVAITESSDGVKYNDVSIRSDITRQLSLNSQSIELKPSVVQPALTTEEASSIADEVNRLINTPLNITARGTVFTPTVAQKSGWVALGTDDQKSKFTYSIDSQAIGAYLGNIASQVNEATTPTIVDVVDGVETNRTDGQSAEQIDISASTNTVTAAFSDINTADVTLQTLTAPPQITYNSSYSPTNGGLYKLLEDWNKNNSGQFGIYVQELGGQGRSASYGGNDHYVTASTYKMFLAFAVLQQVDQGDMDLDDDSGLPGWTVKACIEEMIRQSTNPCAVALGDGLGWTNATNAVRAAGFSQTELNNNNGGAIPGHKWSTPYDEAQFFAKLSAGQLLSPASTSLLTGYLDTQVWKWGLTAGSPGSTVVEKVGWLSPYVNNAGIVYSPNGTYIVGIMSKWSNFTSIGNLSGEIYDYFN